MNKRLIVIMGVDVCVFSCQKHKKTIVVGFIVVHYIM